MRRRRLAPTGTPTCGLLLRTADALKSWPKPSTPPAPLTTTWGGDHIGRTRPTPAEALVVPPHRELTSTTPTADHPKPHPTPTDPPTPPHTPRPREATT